MIIKNENIINWMGGVVHLEKIRFGRIEAVFILINILTIQIFLGFPRAMADVGGTAGWMIPLYTLMFSLVFFFIISKLYMSFEGKDILDIAQIAGGTFGRILVGLIFLSSYFLAVPVILRTFGEDVKIFSLVQSPISFVLLLFLVGMIVASYLGIEAIVRIGSIIVPIVTVGFIVIILGNVKYFEVEKLLPILGSGPYRIFVGAIPQISLFSGINTLYFMSPFIGKGKEFKAIGNLSLILSGGLMTVGTLVYLLVVPYPVSTENVLPYLHLARYVNYGRFFQRIESIFVLTWCLAALVYLSAGLFFIVYIIKKTFRLEYYRPLIVPIAILLFTLCLIPESVMSSVSIETGVFRQYSWLISFVIPLAVLSLAKLVKRKKEGEKRI